MPRRNNGGTVTLDPKKNVERMALLLVAKLTGDEKLFEHIKEFRTGAAPGVIDSSWFEEDYDETQKRKLLNVFRDAEYYNVRAVVFEYGEGYAKD